jgi:hypothetical protein
VVRKILACKRVLEKIKYAVRKIQMLRKANFGKIKYEINTNLPLARLVILSLTGETFHLHVLF